MIRSGVLEFFFINSLRLWVQIPPGDLMGREDIEAALRALDHAIEEMGDVDPGDPVFFIIIFAEGIRLGLSTALAEMD